MFSNCKKDSTNIKNPIQNLEYVKNNGWQIPNLSFCSSGAGTKHNLFLQKVAKLPNFETRTISDIIELLKVECNQEYQSLVSLMQIENQDEVKNIENALCFSSQNRFDYKKLQSYDFQSSLEVVFSKNENETAELLGKFYEKVSSIMTNFEYVEIVANQGKFDLYENEFSSLYDEIKLDKDITAQQKLILEETINVAFFSSLFWIDAMTDPQNEWHARIDAEVQGTFFDYFGFAETEVPNYQDLMRINKGWWKFIVVAAADVAGVIVGAPGGIGGAVALGIAASSIAGELVHLGN